MDFGRGVKDLIEMQRTIKLIEVVGGLKLYTLQMLKECAVHHFHLHP